MPKKDLQKELSWVQARRRKRAHQENVINAMHMDGESMTLFTGCHSIRFWHLAESKLIELHCLMYPFGRRLACKLRWRFFKGSPVPRKAVGPDERNNWASQPILASFGTGCGHYLLAHRLCFMKHTRSDFLQTQSSEYGMGPCALVKGPKGPPTIRPTMLKV